MKPVPSATPLPDPGPDFSPDSGPVGASFAASLAAQSADRAKGARTRARLAIAACAVLEEGGPQGLTVAAVCAGAGVSHGTFYIYFPDRDALLETLLTEFVAFLQIAMRAASAGRPGQAARAATRAYFDLFEANRGLMRCLVHPLDGFAQARAAFQRLNREWIETVTTATERRLARAGQGGAIPRPELLRRAHALGGMVDQYLSGLLLTQDPELVALSPDRETVLETLTLIWERGMSP